MCEILINVILLLFNINITLMFAVLIICGLVRKLNQEKNALQQQLKKLT